MRLCRTSYQIGLTALIFFTNVIIPLTSASSWSSKISSILGGDEDEKKNVKKTTSPIKNKTNHTNDKLDNINRRLEASLSANTWPTTEDSALCEVWAYLDTAPSRSHSSSNPAYGTFREQAQSDNYYDDWKRRYLKFILERNIDEEGDNLRYQGLDLHNQSIFQRGALLALKAASASYHPLNDNSRLPFEESFDAKLMKYSLSLRAYSPYCEMHRALARDAALSTGNYRGTGTDLFPEAFAVVNGNVLLSDNDERIILKNLATYIQNGFQNNADHDTEEMKNETPLPYWATRLPDEKLVQDYDIPDDVQYSEHIAILYGNIKSDSFSFMYNALTKAKMPFVIRFMGAISFEERGEVKEKMIRTTLQGYGVRLDIRNIEYISYDIDEEEEEESEGDLEKLSEKSIDHGEKAKKKAERQRQYLSLQATTVISNSSDPLVELQDISQNLPSQIPSLITIKVPREVKKTAKALNELSTGEFLMERGSTNGVFDFYVNGRRVAVERPSFNLFELLNLFREENKFLSEITQSLSSVLPTMDGLEAARSLIEMDSLTFKHTLKSFDIKEEDGSTGENNQMMDSLMPKDTSDEEKPMRIDVGRGYRGAVIYINNIEKDNMYKGWPRDPMEMLMNMQYGGSRIPMVRRNLFTGLVVLDPLEIKSDSSFMQILGDILRFVQVGYPVRIGILLVNNKDIQSCQNQIEARKDGKRGHKCLSTQPFDANIDNHEQILLDSPATTRDVFILFKHFVKNTHEGLESLGYIFSLLKEIQIYQSQNSIPLLNRNLIDIHQKLSNLIKGVGGAAHEDKIRKYFIDVHVRGDNPQNDDKEETYAGALEFATEKNINAGMIFINGLVCSSKEEDEQYLDNLIMEEEKRIMKLIMEQKITASAPRSIYGMLLTGEKVYSKMHSLLSEKYPVYYPPSSIRFTNNDSSLIHATQDCTSNDDPSELSNHTTILFEGHFNFDSTDGLTLFTSFLSSMELLSLDDDGLKSKDLSVAYRVFSTSSSCLTSLLEDPISVTHKKVLSAVKVAIEVKDSVKMLNFHKMESMLNINFTACERNSKKIESNHPADNYVTANGRLFVPSAPSIAIEDVKLLISMEYDLSKVIKSNLGTHIADGNEIKTMPHTTIAYISAFISKMRFTTAFGGGNTQSKRSDSLAKFKTIIDDSSERNKYPLYFEWNKKNENTQLKTIITAILDPLSEATQRVAPLLRVLRDDLNLPMKVLFIPRLNIVPSSSLPMNSYYRFVANPFNSFLSDPSMSNSPIALFENLPVNHVLTIRMDVPEQWDVQQSFTVQDTDNLRCDVKSCGDAAYEASLKADSKIVDEVKSTSAKELHIENLTSVEYVLNSLLFFGQCWDTSKSSPPNGLQLTLSDLSSQFASDQLVESGNVMPDGSIEIPPISLTSDHLSHRNKDTTYYSDTLVMKTVGYWQLRANPGVWNLEIAKNSRGAKMFEMVEGSISDDGQPIVSKDTTATTSKILLMNDFINKNQILLTRRRPGFENAELFAPENGEDSPMVKNVNSDDMIHVFSLATGHFYERLLKIMMLSATKRASTKIKFWLFENFLSPSFKKSTISMAKRIGCDVEFVTYKWPEWLRGQSEKQRIIWGYKILFLDVLFPLNLKKIIYVDADQVVRGDLKELWDLDLQGAAYGYTPFCDSREETLGYQFWRSGFWKSHLRGKPYHISALYVVDLQKFRRELVGDTLRGLYHQLSADPNSLSNLDQDLPNYAQHMVRIHSLPQEWLWCESWCSDETKPFAKTIDLCNNPEHKEPKVSMAKRIISGDLFEESWIELDAEVELYERADD